MQKSDADILAEAREYLETQGWWRGNLIGPNGRQVCGMGAVVLSQRWTTAGNNYNPFTSGRLPQLHRLLGKVLDAAGVDKGMHATSAFTAWNDSKKTGVKDKQTLLDAFAKAEKIERAGFDPDA